MSKDKNQNIIRYKIEKIKFFWKNSSWIEKSFVIILVLLGAFLLYALWIDRVGRELYLKSLEGWLPSSVTDLLKMISPNDVNDIIDAFNGIWGVTITIAIFIFEIGGTYQYGITLRHIATIKYGANKLFWLAAVYLLIYPAIYLCKSNDCKLTALVLLMGAYVGLVWLLWFTFTQSRADEIKKLLLMKTKNAFSNNIEEFSNKKKSDRDIRSRLGKLEITNVIEHIDYTDAEDIGELIDTLKQIATEKELRQSADNTYIKQLFIMVWTGRIINKSGVDSEYERERTVELLLQLWNSFIQGLFLEFKGEMSDEELGLSYSVQLLLPFIDLKYESALQAMMSIWERLSEYLDATVIYILLYMEFRHYFFETDEADAINNLKDCSKFFRIFKNFTKKNFKWNIELGLKFWVAWVQYKLHGDNIDLVHFEEFCDDIDKLKCERYRNISMTTYIMQNIAIYLERNEK